MSHFSLWFSDMLDHALTISFYTPQNRCFIIASCRFELINKKENAHPSTMHPRTIHWTPLLSKLQSSSLVVRAKWTLVWCRVQHSSLVVRCFIDKQRIRLIQGHEPSNVVCTEATPFPFLPSSHSSLV